MLGREFKWNSLQVYNNHWNSKSWLLFFCLVSWRCKFWVVCSSGLLHLYYQCWQILCLLVFVITLTVFFILESIFWHLCKKGRKVNNLQLLGFVAHSGVGRKIWSNIHVHWPLLLRSFEYNENIFNSCIFMVILIRREKIWQLEAAYVPIFLWREILLKISSTLHQGDTSPWNFFQPLFKKHTV